MRSIGGWVPMDSWLARVLTTQILSAARAGPEAIGTINHAGRFSWRPSVQSSPPAQEALAESLKPESGDSYGYNTGDLSNVVEKPCNVTMLSISVSEWAPQQRTGLRTIGRLV